MSIPASVDRPEFVVQVAPNRVELDEFNRWAAPLDDGIARAVAGDLAVLLGTPDVAVAPLANFDPAYRVTINVQRFESIAGTVGAGRRGVGGAPDRRRRRARAAPPRARPCPGKSYDALAAAHSRALAQLSADIAAAIRSAPPARAD